MTFPVQHGGGTPRKLVVPAGAMTEIVPHEDVRRYLEIQNDSAGNRVHLCFSDNDVAADDIGLYLDPGAVYTMNSTNRTPVRITCFSAAGTNLYIQPGR
jgi:hypothetical protein